MELNRDIRQQLIQELISSFQQHCDLKTKQWFDNYLKGAIAYRGLKTPQVTSIVKDWYLANRLDRYPPDEQLTLCGELIAGDFAEDKFAGTIYLQKYLLKKLDYRSLLAEIDLWFKNGYFFDWSTTDWMCTRVLDPIIVKEGKDAAEIVARWRMSDNLWQKRASIVSFRHASSDRQHHLTIKKIIEHLVTDERRFVQTGIGWVLADMSKNYPTEAERIFRQYLNYLDREVIVRHAKFLDCYQELKQLKRQLDRK